MAQTTSDTAGNPREVLDAIRARGEWVPGSMLRVMSRVSGGVRSIATSIPELEQGWLDRAAAALAGRDPLWVVLGDSTAQGVGASSVAHTWVARIAAALDLEGRRHGVINIARSGARTADVVADQLPILDLLPTEPAIVTCVVGTNDLMRNPAPPVVAGRLRRMAELLPAGSIVATLPSSSTSPSARWINRALRGALHDNGHLVAELGPHLMGLRGLAADRFHPSDRGYDAWVAAFAEPLGLDRRAVPPVADVDAA